MSGALVEALSEAAHEAWMATKRAQGIDSRHSEWGEELMVPYADLTEPAKDLDRGTVQGVLAAADSAGYLLVRAADVSAVRAACVRALAGSGPHTKERRLAQSIFDIVAAS